MVVLRALLLAALVLWATLLGHPAGYTEMSVRPVHAWYPALAMAARRAAIPSPTPTGQPDGDGALLKALRGAVGGRVVDGYRAASATVALVGRPGRAATALLHLVNTGTTTWRGTYGLRLIAGEAVGLPSILLLPDVAPGETVEIPVAVRVPSHRGAQVAGAWTMQNAGGRPFGRPLRLLVRTATPSPARPTTPPTASPTGSPAASATTTPRAWETTMARQPSLRPSPTPAARPTPRPDPLHPAAGGRPTPSPSPSQPTPGPNAMAAATPEGATPSDTPTPAATSASTSAPSTAIPLPPPDLAGGAPPPATSAVARAPRRLPASASESPAAPPPGTGDGPHRRAAEFHASGLVRLVATPAFPSLPPSATPTRPPSSPSPTATAEATTTATADDGARRWLFGGAPLDKTNHQELALLNVTTQRAHVWITIFTDDGRRVQAFETVDAGRLRRLALNDLLAPATGTAAEVRSDVSIVVERVTAHANDLDEGTAGSVAPGWPAAELPGQHALARSPIFLREHQSITVFNPSDQPQRVALQYIPSARSLQPATQGVTVPAGAVRMLVDGLPPRGVVAATTGGAPLVVEENTAYAVTDGLTSLRPAVPAPRWYFAPTAARTGGHSFLTVLNPGRKAVAAVLAALGPGAEAARVFRVAAGAEAVVEPARLLPQDAADRWLVLHADGPIVASRVTVLPKGGEKYLARTYVGSLATTGISAPARRVAFAAGDTRPTFTGIVERLFLLNPGPRPARVRLSYLMPTGRTAAQGVILGVGNSVTIAPSILIGATPHGVLVEADVPVAAAMLWQFNAGAYAAESDGVPLDPPTTPSSP